MDQGGGNTILEVLPRENYLSQVMRDVMESAIIQICNIMVDGRDKK